MFLISKFLQISEYKMICHGKFTIFVLLLTAKHLFSKYKSLVSCRYYKIEFYQLDNFVRIRENWLFVVSIVVDNKIILEALFSQFQSTFGAIDWFVLKQKSEGKLKEVSNQTLFG